MATLIAAAAGTARAVGVRDGGCSSYANFIQGPRGASQRLSWSRPSRIVQLRSSSSRDAGPSPFLGRGRHSEVVSASRDGEVPSEILEDSKFVPITDEDPRFGPPAILLLGFTNEEAVKVQDLLKNMEGDFMQVLLCTEEMAEGTLGEAFDAKQSDLMDIQVANGLPRISFLSGLTGEEIMMFIQIYPEAGLKRTVFAAHVPLNSEKSIAELREEIMDDHRRLSKRDEAAEQTES